MDIKNLTTALVGKTQTEGSTIKPSLASSDQAPHTASQLSPQTVKAIQALLQAQQLGKIFDVVVTKIQGSMVTLQIPDAPADTPVLQTEMKSPPPLGTRLTLQLTDDLATPALKVIARPTSPQDAVSRNLRLTLQQQRAITPLLANLAMLAKTTDRTAADLPMAVIETARQVVQQLNHPVQLKSPGDLKQALRQTGPYLEAALAQQSKSAKTNIPPMPQAPILDKASSHDAKMAQLEYNNQTIIAMTRAMQQQPLKDVRANLLRLAAVIRATTEQQALQKSLGIEPEADELDAVMQNLQRQNPAATKSPTGSGQTVPLSGRPVPLPASLIDANTGKALVGNTQSNTAANKSTAQSPASNTQQTIPEAVRSQTPQPQAATQASLLNILNQKSALDELLGQVEGALARIQVQQLQTAATEQQQRPVWVMELPVRTEQGIDVFDMRIQREQEDSRGDDLKAPWTVSLAFDLEKLGPIRAQIMLYGEDRISTVFWAEKAETSSYFNQHLEKLESRFKQVGLDVARVDCRCGKPNSPPPSREPRLVDEKV